MLFTKKTPAEKRVDFKQKLASGKLIQMPGAHSPIVARIVEELGFDGIYISGGALSADLALPDIGLITLDELTMRGRQIARVTDLPALSDADTGFGEAMNAARTIREMEDAGLAACHLEDQELPKRCGHLDNKILVDTKTMVQKIKAAASARRDPNFVIVARTDSKESEGLDAAIERCKAYVDAGADVLFPEAMHSEKDFAAFRKAFTVPLLANLTEFGKTPLLTKQQLTDLGYNIAIYPVTSLRLAMKNVEDGYGRLKRDETNANIVPDMMTRKRLYEVLHYEDYGAFDQSVYNFKI